MAVVSQGLSPVVVIDTDPQGSLSSWWNRRQADTPAISVLPNLQALPGRVEELRRSGVALVLIDTPPALTNAIRGAMQVANLVAMPVRPSPHDLDAIGATIDLAHQAKADAEFKRRFRVAAANRGIRLNELLVEAFEAWESTTGTT